MSDALSLVPALAAGLLLGAMFFGGLWWTVGKGVASRRPALWFLGSMLLRMSVALWSFYYVGREDWRRWLLCLSGFVLARLILNRLARRPDGGRFRVSETSHAP